MKPVGNTRIHFPRSVWETLFGVFSDTAAKKKKIKVLFTAGRTELKVPELIKYKL